MFHTRMILIIMMMMNKMKEFINHPEKGTGILQRSLMSDKELIKALTKERDEARQRRNDVIKEVIDIKRRLRDLIHGSS